VNVRPVILQGGGVILEINSS